MRWTTPFSVAAVATALRAVEHERLIEPWLHRGRRGRRYRIRLVRTARIADEGAVEWLRKQLSC